MKVGLFYENFLEGIGRAGLPERETLAELKALGLERVYMAYATLAEREEELCGMFAALGLGVEGLYEFYDFGHNPTDESWRKLLDLAKRAGAGNVLLVPGMLGPEDAACRKACLENMAAALRPVVAYGKELGIAVTMEDFDGLEAPYCCVSGLKWFMDQVDGLKCSFDTGNFIMDREDELEALSVFKEKIVTVHAKDRASQPHSPADKAKYARDGSAVYAAPVGSGYIRMGEIVGQMQEAGYDGTWIVELFDYTDMMDGIRQSIMWLAAAIGKNKARQ